MLEQSFKNDGMSLEEVEGATEEPNTHQAPPDGITLLQDEYVLENKHPSIINWSKSLILAGFLVLVAFGGDGISWGAITLALLIGGYVYFAHDKSRYVVTNQRVMKKVGLIRRSTGEARISDIKSLTTDQGIIERIVGMGSVQIDSVGAGGNLGINGVDDHQSLANTIREEQRKLDV